MGKNNDAAQARAAQAVALRSAGATFKQIGIELGVCDERARQLHVKGLRHARLSCGTPSPNASPLSLCKALELPSSLLADLTREGFEDLSWHVLYKVHLALPVDPEKGPQSVVEFADLMIAGVSKGAWGAQPFNVQSAIDVLAWAEPRGSGTITISDERRAQLERAILARLRGRASKDP